MAPASGATPTLGGRGGPGAAPWRAAGACDQQRPGHLCVPAENGFAQECLLRPQRGPRRVEWSGGGVEFHPSHGNWIRVLSVNGFVVHALHELYARRMQRPTSATTSPPPSGPASGRWKTSGPRSSPLDQVLGLTNHPVRMRTTQAGISILGCAGPARTEGGRPARWEQQNARGRPADVCRWGS
jgi:hypothetical protein